jgi:hypothetical protein
MQCMWARDCMRCRSKMRGALTDKNSSVIDRYDLVPVPVADVDVVVCITGVARAKVNNA